MACSLPATRLRYYAYHQWDFAIANHGLRLSIWSSRLSNIHSCRRHRRNSQNSKPWMMWLPPVHSLLLCRKTRACRLRPKQSQSSALLSQNNDIELEQSASYGDLFQLSNGIFSSGLWNNFQWNRRRTCRRDHWSYAVLTPFTGYALSETWASILAVLVQAVAERDISQHC